MNRYSSSFLKSRRSNFVATNINGQATAQREQILDLEAADSRKHLQAPYVFHKNEGFTKKKLEDIVAAEIIVDSYKNGDPCNRLRVTLPSGDKRNYRMFGTKNNILPPRTLTADEVAGLVFGYCTTANVTVTEPDGDTDIVAIYCKLSDDAPDTADADADNQ